MKISSITKLPLYAATGLSFLVSSVIGLGINCRGHSGCMYGSNDVSQKLNDYIQQLSNNAWYNNGQLIACEGNICAFLQNTGGSNGGVLKTLAPYIRAHGCNKCGSVPYYYPQGDNDVANGQLTFNRVATPCGYAHHGLC